MPAAALTPVEVQRKLEATEAQESHSQEAVVEETQHQLQLTKQGTRSTTTATATTATTNYF